jgi:hypothetical protein
MLLWPLPARAQLADDQLEKRRTGESFLQRFKGSYINLTNYMGTGTFVTGFAGNPYYSIETLAYPRFHIARSQSLRLLFSVDCELTQPDNASGTRCHPSDLRLSYHYSPIVVDPWINGMLMGSFMVYAPTSRESQFNNTVMNIRTSLSYLARFFDDRLEAAYSFSVQKYFPTTRYRGFSNTSDPGGDLPAFHTRSSAAEDGAVGSGGVMNDNWLFINSFHVAYYFLPQLSLSVDFLIYNYIRYSVPQDAFFNEGLSETGRADRMRGVVTLTYQPWKHLLLGLGVDTIQPPLNSKNEELRNPFWDKYLTNNFTKFYLSALFIY